MKKRIMMRAFSVALLFILMLPIATVCATSTTYQIDAGNSTIYMHDLANLLTDQEELKLIQTVSRTCDDIHYNILFLTTYNAGGKSTMVYSDDYMDNLFPTGTEDNIAFVIDMDNREIYINTMGNAISCLSDQMINEALDKGYDVIDYGDYMKSLEVMSTYCVSRLTDMPSNVGNSTTSSTSSDTGITSGEFVEFFVYGMFTSIFPALIVAGVVVVILVKKHNKANKAQSATNYIARESYNIINKDEIFIRSYDTVCRGYYRQSSNSGGSSRSGGSSHRSSSGRSHGGGGRKF